MSEQVAWIEFDIDKLKELKESHEFAMQYVKDGLPGLNINSNKELTEFFYKKLGIILDSTRISEIESYLRNYDEHSEGFDIILGVVFYLKMKYTTKNYINCILKHEKDGIIQLREINNKIVMPNKQPIPASQEVLDCVLSSSSGLTLTRGEKHVVSS